MEKSSKENQIRIRAYELSCQRDPSGGSDVQDWLQAEQELAEAQEPTRFVTYAHNTADDLKTESKKSRVSTSA